MREGEYQQKFKLKISLHLILDNTPPLRYNFLRKKKAHEQGNFKISQPVEGKSQWVGFGKKSSISLFK